MAQRVTPIAPVGSLLKGDQQALDRMRKTADKAPRKRNRKPQKGSGSVRAALRREAERDVVHLAAIRRCQCVSCSVDAGCDAAHVRIGMPDKPNPLGAKPADRWVTPLCRACHELQHRVGEKPFWGALKLDPLVLAERLWDATPDVEKMRAIVFTAHKRTKAAT